MTRNSGAAIPHTACTSIFSCTKARIAPNSSSQTGTNCELFLFSLSCAKFSDANLASALTDMVVQEVMIKLTALSRSWNLAWFVCFGCSSSAFEKVAVTEQVSGRRQRANYFAIKSLTQVVVKKNNNKIISAGDNILYYFCESKTVACQAGMTTWLHVLQTYAQWQENVQEPLLTLSESSNCISQYLLNKHMQLVMCT